MIHSALLPYCCVRKANPDLYASIDLVVDKLERQVRDIKQKFTVRNLAKFVVMQGSLWCAPQPGKSEPASEEPEAGYRAVKNRISLKPMSSEEAVLQMAMLGHDFFVAAETENSALSIVVDGLMTSWDSRDSK